MSEKNVITSESLLVEISSEQPLYVDTTPVLSISEGITELIFLINTSDMLLVEIKTYYENMPVYQIVLDFIVETGGVY